MASKPKPQENSHSVPLRKIYLGHEGRDPRRRESRRGQDGRKPQPMEGRSRLSGMRSEMPKYINYGAGVICPKIAGREAPVVLYKLPGREVTV
jgi:hypothetical protein